MSLRTRSSRELLDGHRNKSPRELEPSLPSLSHTVVLLPSWWSNSRRRNNSRLNNSPRWSAFLLWMEPPRRWPPSPRLQSNDHPVPRPIAPCAMTSPTAFMVNMSSDDTLNGCTLCFARSGFVLTSLPTSPSWPTAKHVATASGTEPTTTLPLTSVEPTSTLANAAGAGVGRTVRSVGARVAAISRRWTS